MTVRTFRGGAFSLVCPELSAPSSGGRGGCPFNNWRMTMPNYYEPEKTTLTRRLLPNSTKIHLRKLPKDRQGVLHLGYGTDSYEAIDYYVPSPLGAPNMIDLLDATQYNHDEGAEVFLGPVRDVHGKRLF